MDKMEILVLKGVSLVGRHDEMSDDEAGASLLGISFPNEMTKIQVHFTTGQLCDVDKSENEKGHNRCWRQRTSTVANSFTFSHIFYCIILLEPTTFPVRSNQ